MSNEEIPIEALTTTEQFDQVVALQDEVWSYEESNRMTQKVFLLASHIGGQVLGAYDGETLAGYAMSLPGICKGRPYLHSHHLAVLPVWRNAGVGRSLKLAQREDALARGIELMEWTFDPLEIRNAHLNIARLGAVIRRYKRNFYGESSPPLHGGLPTDRIIAEWWLKSDRVDQNCALGKSQASLTLRYQPFDHVRLTCRLSCHCFRLYAFLRANESRRTAHMA